MSRYLEPKCRLCRREGVKLFLKSGRCSSPKCPIEKKGAVPPGQHGAKRGFKRTSEYGLQLREKQKLKRMYGIFETQIRKLFKVSRKQKAATGEVLLRMLEQRLDNVVYRLQLAPSRSVARQIVSHGHVFVNNKKVKVASFQVKPNDVISLSAKALKIPEIKRSLDQKEVKLPSWLEKKAAVGKVISLAQRQDFPQDINEQLIIEYYSR
jgi:small subunit ribosomal protein S4